MEEGLEDESDQLQIFDGVAWTSEKIELPSFGQDGSFGLFPGCACGAAWNGELVVVCGGSREHEIVPGGDDDEEPQFELVEALPRTYAYDVEAHTWRALPAPPPSSSLQISTWARCTTDTRNPPVILRTAWSLGKCIRTPCICASPDPSPWVRPWCTAPTC